jgi:hypothetical protein
MIEYKVVELTTVTDDQIETVVNEWTRNGWQLEQMQFAMRDSSKRPSMAFIFFTRETESEDANE